MEAEKVKEKIIELCQTPGAYNAAYSWVAIWLRLQDMPTSYDNIVHWLNRFSEEAHGNL